MTMTDRTYFPELTARALVGHLVHARVALPGVRAGTPGEVDRAYRTSVWGGWVVHVTWKAPGKPWQSMRAVSADDYERWIEES